MYDPIGDFFPTYGATVYARQERPPQVMVGEEPTWYEAGPTPVGPWPTNAAVGAMGPWTQADVFEDVFVERTGPFEDEPAPAHAEAPVIRRHRRRPDQTPRPWDQIVACAVGGLSAVMVAAVCLLGWVLSYNPLHDLARSQVPRGLSVLWPLVIYGPWFISCLSAVRAALDGRQLRHSWIVMIVFSIGAAGLCIATSAHAPLNMLVAGLPPLAGLISLHQLVRQLDQGRRGEHRPGRGFTVNRRSR
ncbi:hypothetical protein GCM10009665_33590 [Kitasatospora nipponensis]|uniref:DUF2637 domain-containing protein n=1 Tax=Kitasatospora nipponensis TaxID=258049 RepID=A0ABP4GVL2_9ACTN